MMTEQTLADTLPHEQPRHRRQVAIWLLVCAATVYGMVVLGGVTRLTGSGLSMVKWDPIFGVVPPVTHAAWEQTFAEYKESPEFKKKNFDMDLEGFQGIYWLEYLHRLLGRLVGVLFFVPFVWFAMKRRLARPLVPKLAGLFVLGGLQGVLGWYMVKSGLVNDPHVSPYRLTAHLALAVLLYLAMVWIAFPMLSRPEGTPARGLRRAAIGLLSLAFVTLLSGGFVAGTKAGYHYNTFPLMGGEWVPSGILSMDPAWRNLFENVATVQFDHRVLATLTLLGTAALWVVGRRRAISRAARTALTLWLAAAVAQVTLGLLTLLMHMPIALASLHQAVAVLVLTAGAWSVHVLGGAGGQQTP